MDNQTTKEKLDKKIRKQKYSSRDKAVCYPASEKEEEKLKRKKETHAAA